MRNARRGRVLFNAAVAAAATRISVGFDGDVPDFAGRTVDAAHEPPVDDEPAADTRSQRYAYRIGNAARSSSPVFADRSCVRVVLEHRGQVKPSTEFARKVKAVKFRQIRRAEYRPVRRTHDRRGRNAERYRTRISTEF